MENINESSYHDLFGQIVETINSSRFEAFKAVNKNLTSLNFKIGKLIVDSQTKNNWGKSIVDTLSKDINKIIDGIKGYSPQNLWNMRQFYLEYKGEPDLFELAQEVPWGHRANAHFFVDKLSAISLSFNSLSAYYCVYLAVNQLVI